MKKKFLNQNSTKNSGKKIGKKNSGQKNLEKKNSGQKISKKNSGKNFGNKFWKFFFEKLK